MTQIDNVMQPILGTGPKGSSVSDFDKGFADVWSAELEVTPDDRKGVLLEQISKEEAMIDPDFANPPQAPLSPAGAPAPDNSTKSGTIPMLIAGNKTIERSGQQPDPIQFSAVGVTSDLRLAPTLPERLVPLPTTTPSIAERTGHLAALQPFIAPKDKHVVKTGVATEITSVVAPTPATGPTAAVTTGVALPSLHAVPMTESSLTDDLSAFSKQSNDLTFASAHTSTTPNDVRAAAAHPLQSHAQSGAQQIAMAAVRSQAGTTEIALNPEELGRVRMMLTTAENGVSVSIIAERPETAEMMRRNIEMLAREFRDLGYDSVEFTFGDQPDGSAHGSEQQDRPQDAPEFEDQSPEPQTAIALSGGLDLKL